MKEKTKTPQLEDSFIRIASGKEENDILMALIKAGLSGTEYQVALLVIRKTWGYKKKEDWISLTQFENYTSKTRHGIIYAIKSLVKKNILVKKTTLGKISLYRFNKNFNQWRILVKKNTRVKKIYITSEKKVTPLVKKNTPTKDNITKDNIQKKKEIYKEKRFSSLQDITPEVVQEIADKYKVPVSLVNLQFEKMKNWLEAKGKRYKNYKKALQNWVLSEAQRMVTSSNPRQGAVKI